MKTKSILLLSTLATAALLLMAAFAILSIMVEFTNPPVAVGACEDAYEPDDTYTTAVTITVPGLTSHNFHDDGDVDWAVFSGTAGITYTIETLNLAAGVDTKLNLYSWNGITLTGLASHDNRNFPVDLSSIITWTVTSTDWYYIQIGYFTGGSSGCDKTYNLRITGPPTHVYLPGIFKNYTSECPIVEATVGVGDEPRGIAVITSTNRIYVANHGSNNVSVINGGANSVVSTIDLSSYGSGPNGIAYHPSGLLYVSLADSDRVAMINASTGVVAGTINVGDNPAGVAVNPVTGRVYVANFGSDSIVTDTVSVISGTTVVGTIPVGDAPSQIAVNLVTNRIFVTNHGHGTNYGQEGSSVSVIAGNTDTVTKTIALVLDVSEPGQGPHGIAVNPNTNKIYVAVIDSHRLVVIDGNNLDARPTPYIAPPSSYDVPIWMVAVNPNLNQVYALGCDEVGVHKVFFLDGATNTWLTRLNVGTNPKQGLAFNAGTGRLYVSNEGSDDVTVIRTCSAP